MSRRSLALLLGMVGLIVAWLWAAAAVAQSPSPTPHPVPTTPPGAVATRPPGPWVDPAPPPEGCQAESEPNDRPDGATIVPSEFCVAGTLVDDRDQDLFFYEVAPEDGLVTWQVTVRGVPTTYTSIHVLPLTSAAGVTPIEVAAGGEVARVDSDVWDGTPPGTGEVQLAPGAYLLGISRGLPGYKQDITDDLGYWIEWHRGGSIAPSGDHEPNDDPATASAVSSAFAVSGDLQGTPDVYRWTLGAGDTATPWRVRVRSSLKERLTLQLTTADGQVVAYAQSFEDGVITFHDLVLAAGDHLLTLPAADGPQPYELVAEPVLDADVDAEPNDLPEQALLIDPASRTAIGRLTTDADVDQYLVDVDAALAASLVDVVLDWSDGSERQLCLATETGTRIACQDARAEAALRGLLIPAGRYLLTVSGDGDLDDRYHLRVTAGAGTDVTPEVEPNDDASAAMPVSGAFAVGGDLLDGPDTFAWTLDEADAATTWHLDISGTPGITASVQLAIADGTVLTWESLSTDGAARLWDLRLPPAVYLVTVTPTGNERPRYILRSTVEPAPDVDPEPNGVVARAVPLDPVTHSTRGRIATRTDTDMFRFDVDEPMAATLTDIRLETSAQALHQVCLATDFGSPIQCLAARGGTTLRSLDLAPGPYTLQVSGDADPTGRYTLQVLAGEPRAADAETEPNDRDDLADTWDPALVMHGTAMDGDVDVYRIHIPEGSPEIWRLTIDGPGLTAPDWRQPDGTHLGSVRVSDDATSAAIDDLYLVTGDHLLTIRAEGPYTLELERLGPPDLSAEREPNDDADHAGPLRMDSERTGRLPAGADVDVYRFSLAAPEHIVITVTPDTAGGGGIDVTGASVDLEITSATTSVASASHPEGGGPTVFDGLLQQGDYEVWVRPAGVAAGLPTLPDVTYAIGLERADPFLDPAMATPPELDAQLDLTLATTEVAAYIEDAQQVAGTLRISNDAGEPLDLALDARTTHDGWTVVLPPEVQVPASGPLDIPITVRVPADAWRDEPVRITVRARAAAGAQATTWTTLVPRQDTLPVAAEPYWPIPDALLGGLDVASQALGARTRTEHFRGDEAHDGLVVAGAGLSTSFPNAPVVIEVDLAGDDPVPVAGMTIDPLGGAGTFGERPRAVELSLSLDGETWTPALAVEVGPQAVEQAFVLPAPVEARFARLRVDSTWHGTDGSVVIGEWKVIATPGFAPSNGSIDIADPIRGGHITWTDPDLQPAAEILGTDDTFARSLVLDAGAALQLVIGFADDRAAQVTGLHWQDQPVLADQVSRFPSVDVEVATASPLGPWTSLGTWHLDRAADGTVAPFDLSAPTWARFLRLRLTSTADTAGYWELPAKIAVLERPTDATYRSILGQWGQSSARGIFEWLVPPPLEAAADDIDAGDGADQAMPIAAGAVVPGRVARSVDTDWYELTIPADQNTLTIHLDTEHAGDVRLRIHDATGALVEPQVVSPTDGGVAITALVEAGATYRLELEQPILSVVFTFDTSASVRPWFPLIRAAVGSFAAAIRPGLEAVQVFPFQESDLLEGWSDQAYLVQSAIDAWTTDGGSSALEVSITRAAATLEEREGARAVLVIGDAVGGGFLGGLPLDELARVRPVIFPVHIGGTDDAAVSTHIMQDLAITNGGTYRYATSLGEMERAFDRMATWMRRPAVYTLAYDTSLVEYPPGRLGVVPAEGAQMRIGGVAVELVLDTSGSMLEPLAGSTRIEVAKQSLSRLVAETLPEGLPVALRTFKAARKSCDTVLAVKLGPLDRAAMQQRIAKLKLHKSARTPLAKAIAEVAGDIGDVPGPRVVVVVTDGAESCKGDPEAAIRSLMDAGFETTINIVGLALDDEELKTRMASWAEMGGGVFFDAQDPDGLSAAISAALRAPFRVIDDAGLVVATGLVGGDPVEVPIGTYRVEVLTEPMITIDDVGIGPGAAVELTVGDDPG